MPFSQFRSAYFLAPNVRTNTTCSTASYGRRSHRGFSPSCLTPCASSLLTGPLACVSKVREEIDEGTPRARIPRPGEKRRVAAGGSKALHVHIVIVDQDVPIRR